MAENSEISTLCSFHLNDFVFQEGHWVWESSGVPFTYTNWRSGEPNNSGGNEDCVYKYYDYWNDDVCTNMVGMLSLKIHALCEYNEI